MRMPALFSALILITSGLVSLVWAEASTPTSAQPARSSSGLASWSSGNARFEISFPASLRAEPVAGRVFLFVSKSDRAEPRLQSPVILLGADVRGLRPGETAIIDAAAPGLPLHNLSEVPPGDYYVQAVLNVYTEFHRADGHVVWAHMDQWEGQQFNLAPGNLISEPQKLHLDPGSGYSFKIS